RASNDTSAHTHGRNKALGHPFHPSQAPSPPPGTPLTAALELSGSAGCWSEGWLVAPVGVRGTRGRCAAFRSVQGAGDSPSPSLFTEVMKTTVMLLLKMTMIMKHRVDPERIEVTPSRSH
ncbi:hypothetical protein D4764_01G0004950, partial [Takifugu flavidus]